LREHKEHLREANANKSRLIARHTGQTHAAVNAELNRVSGVKKVSEATVEQLERRLQKADAWLRQASARRVAG
jgi:ribosomal protein S4